jgi:hypothetical protein
MRVPGRIWSVVHSLHSHYFVDGVPQLASSVRPAVDLGPVFRSLPNPYLSPLRDLYP